MEQLKLPKLDLPVLLDRELLERCLRVSRGALHGIDMVKHVDEHAHFVLLDVSVFFAVKDEEAKLEDVFLLEKAVRRDGMQPFGKGQLLEIPYTCFWLWVR